MTFIDANSKIHLNETKTHMDNNAINGVVYQFFLWTGKNSFR